MSTPYTISSHHFVGWVSLLQIFTLLRHIFLSYLFDMDFSNDFYSTIRRMLGSRTLFPARDDYEQRAFLASLRMATLKLGESICFVDESRQFHYVKRLEYGTIPTTPCTGVESVLNNSILGRIMIGWWPRCWKCAGQDSIFTLTAPTRADLIVRTRPYYTTGNVAASFAEAYDLMGTDGKYLFKV